MASRDAIPTPPSRDSLPVPPVSSLSAPVFSSQARFRLLIAGPAVGRAHHALLRQRGQTVPPPLSHRRAGTAARVRAAAPARRSQPPRTWPARPPGASGARYRTRRRGPCVRPAESGPPARLRGRLCRRLSSPSSTGSYRRRDCGRRSATRSPRGGHDFRQTGLPDPLPWPGGPTRPRGWGKSRRRGTSRGGPRAGGRGGFLSFGDFTPSRSTRGGVACSGRVAPAGFVWGSGTAALFGSLVSPPAPQNTAQPRLPAPRHTIQPSLRGVTDLARRRPGAGRGGGGPPPRGDAGGQGGGRRGARRVTPIAWPNRRDGCMCVCERMG